MPLVLLEDSEEYLKRFGQKVKQLRIANNMTMQELASRSGRGYKGRRLLLQ